MYKVYKFPTQTENNSHEPDISGYDPEDNIKQFKENF